MHLIVRRNRYLHIKAIRVTRIGKKLLSLRHIMLIACIYIAFIPRNHACTNNCTAPSKNKIIYGVPVNRIGDCLSYPHVIKWCNRIVKIESLHDIRAVASYIKAVLKLICLIIRKIRINVNASRLKLHHCGLCTCHNLKCDLVKIRKSFLPIILISCEYNALLWDIRF